MRLLIIFFIILSNLFATNPVSVTFLSESTNFNNKIIAKFNIAKNYHIYSPNNTIGSPPKFKWHNPKSIDILEIKWPAAKEIVSPIGKINIYKENMFLEITFKSTNNIKNPKLSADIEIPICKDNLCFLKTVKAEIKFPIKNIYIPTQQTDFGFLLILLFAFLGGVILNFMPCVFPVLAIKVLSITDSQSSKKQNCLFILGIVTSFLILAIILTIFRNSLHWGFQMQSPVFIKSLAILFLLMGLNLFGLFEVGIFLTRISPKINSKNLESFFNGTLMAVVATPCTSPFMGSAIASVLGANNLIFISTIVILGVGLAFPFILMCFVSSIKKYIPKPGKWMVNLKHFFGFCLIGTTIWLTSVYAKQTNLDNAINLMWGFLFLSISLWFYGNCTKKTKIIGSILFLILGIHEITADFVQNKWTQYNEQEIINLHKKHIPYFIDFGAQWCVTCKVNKQLVLNTKEIFDLFSKKNIKLFSADLTTNSEIVKNALKKYKRAGVPTYILFDGNKTLILPELLTKSKLISELSKIKDKQ